MALTADEQELFDFAMAAMPYWFQADDRSAEFLGGVAKLMGAAKTQAVDWWTNAIIATAVGADASNPDWLAQHAADRGTARQESEGDPALRDRLRTVADAVTRPALLAAAQSIVIASGVSELVYMVEVRREKAYFQTLAAETGTGGVFSGTPPDMVFTPTVPFGDVPYRAIAEARTFKLVISGAASAGNDGTFPVTGISGDGVAFTNASGVAETDGTASWQIGHYDTLDNPLDGFRDAYLGRGDRIGSAALAIILILPYGTTEATRQAVLEMLRQKKGAGVLGIAERRAVP